MLSHSMTTNQLLSLFKKEQSLCEINNEYPSLNQSSLPRHLCTCTKPLKSSESIPIAKLLSLITTEHQHEKESKKQSNNVKEESELIELKQDDEVNNKLYKKHRYQRNDNEDKRDNTN